MTITVYPLKRRFWVIYCSKTVAIFCEKLTHDKVRHCLSFKTIFNVLGPSWLFSKKKFFGPLWHRPKDKIFDFGGRAGEAPPRLMTTFDQKWPKTLLKWVLTYFNVFYAPNLVKLHVWLIFIDHFLGVSGDLENLWAWEASQAWGKFLTLFSPKIILNVVQSISHLAQRDQRPQISLKPYLTQIFWQFRQKNFLVQNFLSFKIWMGVEIL